MNIIQRSMRERRYVVSRQDGVNYRKARELKLAELKLANIAMPSLARGAS